MTITTQLLVFRLDDRRYALALDAVERVLRAVEVTPLPNAPPIVAGIVNVHGRVLPVLNLRRRFRLPDRAIAPGDCLLLARTAHRSVALPIDESEGVLAWPRADIVPSAGIAPGLELFPGVVRLHDTLVVVHDLDRFLSFDDEQALDAAWHAASDDSRSGAFGGFLSS